MRKYPDFLLYPNPTYLTLTCREAAIFKLVNRYGEYMRATELAPFLVSKKTLDEALDAEDKDATVLATMPEARVWHGVDRKMNKMCRLVISKISADEFIIFRVYRSRVSGHLKVGEPIKIDEIGYLYKNEDSAVELLAKQSGQEDNTNKDYAEMLERISYLEEENASLRKQLEEILQNQL